MIAQILTIDGAVLLGRGSRYSLLHNYKSQARKMVTIFYN